MGLNVLVVDRAAPRSASQGNELIARHLMPLLRRRHRMTLLAADVPPRPDDEPIDGLFDAVHLVPRDSRIPALAGAFDPLLGRLPVVSSVASVGPIEPAFGRRFEAALRALRASDPFDLIHTRQLPMAGYTRGLHGVPRLLELVDSETLAAQRSRRRGVRATVRRASAAAIERAIVRSFDAVTTVAEADAAAVRRLAPGTAVSVVPNGVDADWFRPRAAPPVGGPSEGPTIVFVGAMHFPPNVEAMRWFVADVLPIVRRDLPGLRLRIVGRDPVAEVVALGEQDGVEVTGRVPDVRPYLETADVVVCPMVSGGGMKNKLLEAMAMARPVVATPLAAEGLGLVDGTHLRLAETPDGFARAVLAVLNDPGAERLGQAGRDVVVARYSWEACADAYDALYRQLVAAAPPAAARGA